VAAQGAQPLAPRGRTGGATKKLTFASYFAPLWMGPALTGRSP